MLVLADRLYRYRMPVASAGSPNLCGILHLSSAFTISLFARPWVVRAERHIFDDTTGPMTSGVHVISCPMVSWTRADDRDRLGGPERWKMWLPALLFMLGRLSNRCLETGAWGGGG